MKRFFRLAYIFFTFLLHTYSATAQDRYFDLSLCSSQAATELLAIQSSGAKVSKPESLAFNGTSVLVQGYMFSSDHTIDMRLTFYKGRLMEIYIPIHDPAWHRRLFLSGFSHFLSMAIHQKYNAPTETVFGNRGGVDNRQWLIANSTVKIKHQLNQYDNLGREEQRQLEYFSYTCMELMDARTNEILELRRDEQLIREQRIRDATGKI